MTATAASGLRARMESLDLLANNMANASTGGYKADREFYSLYVAPEAQDPDSPPTMPVIEKPWTDLSQGLLAPTGNPLDVALEEKVFLAFPVLMERCTPAMAAFIWPPTAPWSPPTATRCGARPAAP